MATTARRTVALLAAGLLAAATSAAAGAQDGSRLPVAAPGPVLDDPRVPAPRPPGDGRRGGLLPLDPDARGLVHRPRRARPRPLRDRRRLHAFTTFFVPVPERGPRAAGARSRAAGDAGRRGGRPSRDRDDRGDDGGDRLRPEGPCFEVSVRMEGGGTHRIRIDGAALDAVSPDDVERRLRARMASRGALAVDGLDGASLHLDADRVHGLTAERCPAVVVP